MRSFAFFFLAMICIVAMTTATLANVQFELDKILEAQKRRQPTVRGPMTMKSLLYPKEITRGESIIGLTVMDIPTEVTLHGPTFRVPFRGVEISRCDIIERTYTNGVSESQTLTNFAPRSNRELELTVTFPSGKASSTYDINVFCKLLSASTDFAKAQAFLWNIAGHKAQTLETYFERYTPLAQDVKVTLRPVDIQPRNDTRFYSISVAVQNLLQPITEDDTFFIAEMIQNMKFVDVPDQKPECTIKYSCDGVKSTPVVAEWGQFHGGQSLEIKSGLNLRQGLPGFTIECSSPVLVSNYDEIHKHQWWAVTTKKLSFDNVVGYHYLPQPI